MLVMCVSVAVFVAVVNCGEPYSDASTSVVQLGNTVGAIAVYSCVDENEAIVGEFLRRCESNGQWSGTAPTCSLAGALQMNLYFIQYFP